MRTRLWWFRVFNAVASVVTVLFLFGVLKSQPVYFVQANTAVKCVLACWLIYRFKGSEKITFTEFDRHACFVAGSYILLSTFAEYMSWISGLFRGFLT